MFIDQLWGEAIRDDTMYEIYLRKTIENALKLLEEGKVISHEEAIKMLLKQ